MSFIDSAGRSFDRLIGVFSPQSQAGKKRVCPRYDPQRQYAAAREDRLTGSGAKPLKSNVVRYGVEVNPKPAPFAGQPKEKAGLQS